MATSGTGEPWDWNREPMEPNPDLEIIIQRFQFLISALAIDLV